MRDVRARLVKLYKALETGMVYYTLPMPPEGKTSGPVGVLPIVTSGGPTCDTGKEFADTPERPQDKRLRLVYFTNGLSN